jgi:hypothetical protein
MFDGSSGLNDHVLYDLGSRTEASLLTDDVETREIRPPFGRAEVTHFRMPQGTTD